MAEETRAFYTVDEAAAFLGCHHATVRHAVRMGTIPHIRVGRLIKIPAKKLADIMGISPEVFAPKLEKATEIVEPEQPVDKLKRGRPRKSQGKMSTFCFRINPDFRAQLEAAALRSGRSLGDEITVRLCHSLTLGDFVMHTTIVLKDKING